MPQRLYVCPVFRQKVSLAGYSFNSKGLKAVNAMSELNHRIRTSRSTACAVLRQYSRFHEAILPDVTMRGSASPRPRSEYTNVSAGVENGEATFALL